MLLTEILGFPSQGLFSLGFCQIPELGPGRPLTDSLRLALQNPPAPISHRREEVAASVSFLHQPSAELGREPWGLLGAGPWAGPGVSGSAW